jgi:hypothetical protein
LVYTLYNISIFKAVAILYMTHTMNEIDFLLKH